MSARFHVLLALLLSSFALPTVAADLPFSFDTPYRVVVPFETIQILPGLDAMGDACASTRVHGCTVFYGRRLDCRCVADENHWRLRARAQFIPDIAVADPPVLQHERMHVAEVRGYVADHLASLTSEEFQSYDGCEAAGRNASAAFPALMDAFERESNVRHHPMYVHALEEQ